MIIKKINLLAITLAIFASNLSFAAENSNQMDDKARADRYAYIEVNFNSKTNQFEDGYFREQNDLDIVKEHKTTKEKKIAEYQKSWIPLLLKITGTGFGIDAALSATYGIVNIIPSKYSEYTQPIYQALRYTGSAISPIRYPRTMATNIITKPARDKLFEMYKEDTISSMMWRLGNAPISFGTSLFSASIAALLFKKANSYQEDIDSLKIIIEHDDQMIQALEKLPVQNSQ